jgi:CubicO group peptidase (beta-lactamase class C family)
MTSSTADPRDAVRPDRAQGHSKLFGFPVPRTAPPHRYVMGAGSVTSTARDMSRLLLALQNGGALGGTRILSPESAVYGPGVVGAFMVWHHYGLRGPASAAWASSPMRRGLTVTPRQAYQRFAPTFEPEQLSHPSNGPGSRSDHAAIDSARCLMPSSIPRVSTK